jgi:copper chaperone CopZ
LYSGRFRSGGAVKINAGGIFLKKRFALTDLDCAGCAAKMEDAIKKIDGVNDAVVSFMAQRLTLDAEDARFDAILDEVVRVCRKVEPDCVIQR